MLAGSPARLPTASSDRCAIASAATRSLPLGLAAPRAKW